MTLILQFTDDVLF